MVSACQINNFLRHDKFQKTPLIMQLIRIPKIKLQMESSVKKDVGSQIMSVILQNTANTHVTL